MESLFIQLMYKSQLKKKMDHYDWFCGPEKTPVGGNKY